MSTRGRLGLIAVLPLYMALATALGFVDARIRSSADVAYTKYVPNVIAGIEEPPGRYRVLAPFAFDALRRATGLPAADAWTLFRWLCLFGSLLALHLYLRTWFDLATTAGGVAIAAGLLPLTFTNGWGHPDHFLELGLFALGCAAAARDAGPWFVVLVALNAANRETAAFLVMLYALAGPLTRSRLIWTAAAALAWAGVYVGVRQWLGWVAYDPWQTSRNLDALAGLDRGTPPVRDFYFKYFAWFGPMLALPAVTLIAGRWRDQVRFTRVAAALVTPAYIVIAFLFSYMVEARIFTMLIPLLLPGLLLALFPRAGASQP